MAIPTRFLLLLAAVALLVRLVYVTQLSQTPFFNYPVVDGATHDDWAREILRSGPGHEGVFFRAPLYPYLLAAAYAVSDGSYFAPRILQAVLGTITAVLAALLGAAVTGRWVTGLGAGILTALAGPLVYYDGELLAATLFTPLLTGAALAWARLRGGRRLLSPAPAGLLLGLAAITWPVALILAPAFLGDLLLTRGAIQPPGGLTARIGRAAVFLTALALPILPITLHNLRRGDAVLIASGGGVNLYIGNNPEADGLHAVLPGVGSNWNEGLARRRAERAVGRPLTPSGVSDYYAGLAHSFFTEHPADAAALFARKLCAFWNRLRVSNNRDLYVFSRETAILPWLHLAGFWLVAPLGLVGFWIGWRRGIPAWFQWLGILYLSGVVLYFVNERFRAPFYPLMAIAAALTLSEAARPRSPWVDRPRLLLLGGILLAFAAVHTNPWSFNTGSGGHPHLVLGTALQRSGRQEAARDAYREAAQRDPALTEVYFRLGTLEHEQGNREEAIGAYRKEIGLNPGHDGSFNNLGVLLCQEGLFIEAERHFRRAVELNPENVDARNNLNRCRLDMRRGPRVPAPASR